MTYYKVIQNNEFVGIGTSYDLREYQEKHNILVVSNENEAQYIQINDKLYRDNWFKILVNDTIKYEMATISVIDENEYKQLFEAIDKGEEIAIETEDNNIYNSNDDIISEEENITVEYLKSQKIKEMSYMCNQTITNGFDIVLSDNKQCHFSLTVQDQLNLITISAMLSNGETQIPYHADGELCRNYSAEDMNMIIETATKFKTYHTTYYNSLKIYINSLTEKDDIKNIYYGIEVPDEFKSDVLKGMEV